MSTPISAHVPAASATAPAAIVPRPAASLLVLRGTGASAEVLMGRRGAGHRFMPNVLVFPGGAVDEADFHANTATPLAPAVVARLERSAAPRLARALGHAAARELHEEVGMSLGDPPALGGLAYLCRAITPPDQNVRFDARFFVVDAAQTRGEPEASREIEDPAWYTIESALAGDLALVTKLVLGQLQRFLAHQTRDGAVPVLNNRVWTEE